MDTESASNDNSAKLAALNDAARSNAFNYVATRGVMALEPKTISEIFMGVQQFEDFNEDNNPYGEHDFGALTVSGNRVFWKIDYYNKDLSMGCDPFSDECCRVITIMLPEEY